MYLTDPGIFVWVFLKNNLINSPFSFYGPADSACLNIYLLIVSADFYLCCIS